MTELPRVKLHTDGTLAVRQPGDKHWSIPGRRHWYTDEQVSGPGWRDAAVVLLVEPSDFHASDIPVFRLPDGFEAYVGPLDGSEMQMASVYASAAAWAKRQEGDAYVSGPGWRDAAVVPLVEPYPFQDQLWLLDDRTLSVDDGKILEDGCRARTPGAARAHAAALLSAAAWAERQAETEDAVQQ